MTDRRTILLVIAALAVLALVALGSTVALIVLDKDPSSVALISGICGTCVGALTAMLVSTRSSGDGPADGPTPPVTGTFEMDAKTG